MNTVKAALNDTGPSGLAWLAGLLGEDAALLDQFDCSVADLNGGLVDDTPTPNGMLDGEFELRVLYELMLNPGTYAGLATGTMTGQVQAGIDASLLEAGFTNNFQGLYTDGMHQTVTLLLPTLWGTLQGASADEVKLVSVPAGATVTINGVVYTAHASTTTAANREFSIAGDDVADAAALNGLINNATYGVPAVKSAASGNTLKLTIKAGTISNITVTASDPSFEIDDSPDIPFLTQALKDTMFALFPNIMTLLAGYATIGDTASMDTVISLAAILQVCGVLDPEDPTSCVIGDVVTDPELYVKFPAFLGPDGDADGDGFTNREEYDLFAGVKGSQEYINAVLNPAIPGSGEGEGAVEGEGEGTVEGETGGATIYPSGTIQVPLKGMIDLLVETSMTGTLTYQWLKDGDPLEFETSARLKITNVTNADGGVYRARVSNEGKAIVLSPPVTVVIVAEDALPLAGGLGLGALASICALGGAMIIRRKK
jgi:hypothetical protein